MKRMSETERFTKAFDAAARDFDRLGEYLWRPIAAATLERVPPREGERVLDACCGDGASAVPAARSVTASGHVDAVDLSASLVGGLGERAAELEQLAAHRADVTTWRSDGYDVVLCVLGVFFFPDMASGTEHLVSRARPGGRVGVTIWRRGAVEAAGRHLQLALTAVTGAEARQRPELPVDRVNDAEAFGLWLAERGLDEVSVTTYEHQVPMTPEVAWLVITGSGFAAGLANLSAGQVEEVREAYLESLREAGVDRLDASALIGTGVRPGGVNGERDATC